MQVVQTRLRHVHAEMVTWLPVDLRVKVGSMISLKNDPDSWKWEVIAQYTTQDSDNIQRGWGLGLPKTQRTER